ncbi:hypothetical protein [Arthrobacter tecti]
MTGHPRCASGARLRLYKAEGSHAYTSQLQAAAERRHDASTRAAAQEMSRAAPRRRSQLHAVDNMSHHVHHGDHTATPAQRHHCHAAPSRRRACQGLPHQRRRRAGEGPLDAGHAPR